MKYNIHVTQAAERDMANAYDYIDLVLKNPNFYLMHKQMYKCASVLKTFR